MDSLTDKLKSEIDIVTLATQLGYTLQKDGRRFVTAENESLTIYPDNNSWTRFSQAGSKGKALGGSVIDLYMHTKGCNLEVAIKELQRMTTLTVEERKTVTPIKVQPKPQPEQSWRSPDWQAKAREQMEHAQYLLMSTTIDGATYLAERGIGLDAALAWNIGYSTDCWNGKAKRKMAGIVIPYMNKQITALQYRFLGISKEDKAADRFGMMPGSTRYLCGLHLLDEANPQRCLFLTEGELNAVSIWQESYRRLEIDAISFGAQANISNPDVIKMISAIAKRYELIVVWADEPEVATAGLQALGKDLRIKAVRSPVIAGVKMDANEMLKRGMLGDVLAEMITDLLWYVGRNVTTETLTMLHAEMERRHGESWVLFAEPTDGELWKVTKIKARPE